MLKFRDWSPRAAFYYVLGYLLSLAPLLLVFGPSVSHAPQKYSEYFLILPFIGSLPVIFWGGFSIPTSTLTPSAFSRIVKLSVIKSLATTLTLCLFLILFFLGLGGMEAYKADGLLWGLLAFVLSLPAAIFYCVFLASIAWIIVFVILAFCFVLSATLEYFLLER